jgi:hypothetical protein
MWALEQLAQFHQLRGLMQQLRELVTAAAVVAEQHIPLVAAVLLGQMEQLLHSGFLLLAYLLDPAAAVVAGTLVVCTGAGLLILL